MLPFARVWTHVAPKRCPLGPKWINLGPECVLRAETEKWLYFELDGPIRASVDTFPTCKPHFRAVPVPALRMAQTHHYKRFLPTGCPFSRILADFGLCVSTEKGWVKNGQK